MPDGDRRPQQFVDLAYPADALAARLQGFVVIDLDIDDQGHVSSTRVLAGAPLLAEPAAANARQWVFEPYAGRTAVVYRFDIDAALCNDDTGGLFRLESPTLATVTACSAPWRAHAKWPDDDPYVTVRPRIEYPHLAYNAGAGGTIVVKLSLAADGGVASATAIAGPSLLAYSAVDNAKAWKFAVPAPREVFAVYEFVVKHRLIPLEHCAMATAYEIPYPNYIRLGVSGRCIDVSAQNQHEYEH
jgi:TonB family protein